MNVCELFHQGLYRGALALVASTLALSCAPKRPHPVAVPPPPTEAPSSPKSSPEPESSTAEETERLYRELEDLRRQYEGHLESLSAGDRVDEESLSALSRRLYQTASECQQTDGCDVAPFLEAMSDLIREQNVMLAGQRSGLIDSSQESDALDDEMEREPGTSPFVSEMPQLGTTVSLLRGTDLRDIINLNGPVKAALNDWLTWMRPMLMDAHENYQYLRHKIAPIYQRAGLPEALLFAMIATETGGRVHSHSRAGAAGLLQFMPQTGRRYGLRVVDGFDLRLDPEAATRANVAYLNEQFEVLNDSLEKALAAYNGGEHRMRRLDRQFRGATFWDGRVFYRLPRETREYVPRILAAAWLFLHPEDYNLVWPDLKTETIDLVLRRDASLGELTICLGQVESRSGWFRTLRNLNPRLTPGERVKAGSSIEIPKLLLPFYEESCLAGEVMETAAELHTASYPHGETDVYVVQPGDTLGRIASRLRCASTREIAELNSIRAPQYIIRVGQRLRVPLCP